MTNASSIAVAHAGLLDIDEVKPFSDEDKQCFDELRSVLERHGALQRFGVTLLHNHFPIYEDEMLVEECDEATRTLKLKPVKRSDVKQEQLMQTNWRLDTGDSTQGCTAYCLMDQGRHVGPKHAAT